MTSHNGKLKDRKEATNKAELFSKLLKDFLKDNNEIIAIIISDQDGLIIAGEKRKNIDMEIVSVLTSIINPILDRIRYEFDFKKFGSCSFETDKYRLIFISVDENVMISIVLSIMASIEKFNPYSYFLAEKIAQILEVKNGDLIQFNIPNFEYEAEQSMRLKNQLYQLQIDTNGMYRFKFIIIGDHKVGKTSIIRRFVEKNFLADYRATIGLNILSHNFEVFGNSISAFIWDIGAQEYFRRVRKTYYNGVQAAFIVFNLTSKKTFENVKNWYNELFQFIENKELPIIIVGNKSDLASDRIIDYESGVELSKELSEIYNNKVSYIETSALTGKNIEDSFKLMAYNYITKCKEIEQERVNKELLTEIYSILKIKKKLVLSFISDNPIWSPALQILVDIIPNEECVEFIDNEDEKYYHYANGLILKNCVYFLKEVWDSDGVFCIFDARNKVQIDSKWKYIITKVLEYLQKNKVLIIGIQVSEETDWSQLISEFNIDEELERKIGSILFFKIGNDYRTEIYNQLIAMLNSIKYLNIAYTDLK